LPKPVVIAGLGRGAANALARLVWRAKASMLLDARYVTRTS
jgi:hypothetical protein